MSFFKQVVGEAAILRENGIFRQVDLYTRDGYLYAKFGSGFVWLAADGSTTKAKVALDHMSWTGQLCHDRYGRLCTNDVPEAIPLEAQRATLLLGVPQTEGRQT